MLETITQSRWTSPILWSALITQIFEVLISQEVLAPELGGALRGLLIAACTVWQVVAIANNPSFKNRW